MLTIKKRLIQPMTALYIATGITAFTVTLGGLLLVRPDFTPNQSVTFDSSRQESLPEVRTTSTTKTSPSENSEVSTESSTLATPSPRPLQQSTAARSAVTSPTVAQQQTPAESQPQQSSPATEPTTQTPVTPSLEPTVPEVEPTETPQQQNNQPSLVEGLLGIVDAIL